MPNKPKYPMTGVSLNPKIKQEVVDVAKSLGIPFNQAVAEALELWLNKQ